MNEIKIKSDSMASFIKSLQDEMERLVHYGEVVAAVPEINEMKPDVFLDHTNGDNVWGGGWTVVFQFDNCYARIYDSCRIRFVHFDDPYMSGRKEELVPYHSDEELVEEFKKHANFLK